MRDIKVLHINNSDLNGGAAKAAYRIHKALLNNGVSSNMLVVNKKSDEYNIIQCSNSSMTRFLDKLRAKLDNEIKKIYDVKKDIPWSVGLLNNNRIVEFINSSKYDIIHFHWINNATISINDIQKIRKPIVWTMHDMWAFTGGCHYTGNCTLYMHNCEKCNYLKNGKYTFLSKYLWFKKKRSYYNKNIFYVSPSKWLLECARKSTLLLNEKIYNIPNCINLNIYKPIDKKNAREILNLDLNKKYILFGAIHSTIDNRKGFDLLIGALNELKKYNKFDNLALLVFGASKPEIDILDSFEIIYFGKCEDDYTLNLIYNSADVFVAPSREDNLPNTIVEALSCGIPCVGFEIGGIPDMIKHMENGYLAKPFSISDLSQGIIFAIDNFEYLTKNARISANNMFSMKRVSQMYKDIYMEILNYVNINEK